MLTDACQVVYGDTDSLFVHLPGRTKDQAFRIGNEIADAVTSVNPRPVKLKFEKVRQDASSEILQLIPLSRSIPSRC